MSLLKTNSVQIGQSVTATENFTITTPTVPNGILKISRGNSGATTQDVITVDSNGNTDLKFTQTSGVQRSLISKLKDVVSVKDFGAVGDGVTDDTAAIRAAHLYANSINATVSYSGILKLAILANASIPVKASIDFAGCEFSIIGGVVGAPSYSSYNTLFIVSDDACPLTTVTGAVSADNLTVGSMFPTLGLFDNHGFALLECNYQVPNRDGTTTQNFEQAFKVNRNGRVSHPLSVDVSAYAGAITVTSRPTSKNRLSLTNMKVIEGSWNNQILFRIDRCNVSIENLIVLDNGGGIFNNICALVQINNASDVLINNFITSGRPVTISSGSYCLNIEGGADIYVNGMNALTGWGATGNNNINGITFTNCVLNRVDVHSSGHNIFVDNCSLHEHSIVYGWGGGLISLKNSRLINTSAGISNRGDWGGTFFGDIVVSNCEFNNSFTSTLYIVDLLTRPIGASVATYCPNTITVSDISRIGKASATNSELIPVAIKVLSNKVVYAPSAINISNISAVNTWRLGSRFDFMNMEGNPGTSYCTVSINNCYATTASNGLDSVLTTGILDFASALTPTTPVRPKVIVNSCDNVAIHMRQTTNTQVFVSNSSINAIVTVAGENNKVRVSNCRLYTTSTGFTIAPLGNAKSGTTGYTIINNCDFSGAVFDISLASMLQGISIRFGASSPILPTGVTEQMAFDGYKDPTVFK